MGAASVLFRYRIRSIDIVRHTDRGARTFLTHDIRGRGRLSFPEIRFIAQLFARILPLQTRSKQGKTAQI